MKALQRTFAVAATVSTIFLVHSGAQAHSRPLITDPAGDADQQTCFTRVVTGLLEPTLSVPCPRALLSPPVSQPAVDILAADFRTRDDVLIGEIEVLDLDHPVIGSDGNGPEDAELYEISINTGGPAIVLGAERATDGTVRRVKATLWWGPAGTYSIPTPPVVTFDDNNNLVRMEIPFHAINDVMLPICSYCQPVERGTEARWPAAQAAVLDTLKVSVGEMFTSTSTEWAAFDRAETEDTYTIGR